MKAHLPILAAAAFGQGSAIKGLTTDDEDILYDGSGSGCFGIPADGICNCNTLLTCLQTCDDLTCNQVLGACLGDDTFNGNCGSHANSTSGKPLIASSTEIPLWITGGVLSAILLTAAVIMIVFRKRKCCCKRKNEQVMEPTPQIALYQPNLQDQDQQHHYARIPINSVGIYIQEKDSGGFYSKMSEEITPSLTSFSFQKYQINQNSASENDYQTMPEMSETYQQKSDRPSVGSTSPKHSIEVKRENKTIQYTNQSYQLINDSVPSDHYQEMNAGQAPDKRDHYSHYQPMDATDHYLAMSSPDGTTTEDEYTVMGESENRNSSIDIQVSTQSNIYSNETEIQEPTAYANASVGRTRNTPEVSAVTEDEVYEKMSY